MFCQGLAASNFRDNISYAVVANASTPHSVLGSDDRKVSGLFLRNVPTVNKQYRKPVTKHKVTMCNVDRLDTVVDKHVLPTRPFHKRTVGQEHVHTLGQVLPLRNRFTVLQTDTQTQDTDSIGDDYCDGFLHISLVFSGEL